MIKHAFATSVFSLAAFAAQAVEFVNNGPEAVEVSVVENGNRAEYGVEAGGRAYICGGGCFVTLPNGDRLAAESGETIEFDGVTAVVK